MADSETAFQEPELKLPIMKMIFNKLPEKTFADAAVGTDFIDSAALGSAIRSSNIAQPQADEITQQKITTADVEPYVKDYSQANSYDAQHTIISAIASMAPFIDPVQENSIVQLLSEMKDGKGVKLFESKEEVIRFLSRARGLRGNVKNNNKGKNRRAIFLNTSNHILPPEEITEKNERLYVDKHPLAYQF